MNFILPYTGVIATCWISLGIYLTAKFYPGYNHRQQFCSELGAIGSPTQTLSPAINNYPLSLLFSAFGIYLCTLSPATSLLFASGIMIILHGAGTALAGFFAMDADPYIQAPSKSGRLHGLAGMVVMLSLLLAIIFCALDNRFNIVFRVYSLFSLCAAVFFTVKMASAYKAKHNAGLYQRLCYWAQLIWLSVLSILSAQAPL